MKSFRLLPAPLLALLFALPVLSEPNTPNDPFRDIATQVRKEPEHPICCLRPLTPLENTEEDVLFSFEEWKARQITGSDKDQLAGHKPPTLKPVSQPRTTDVASETALAADHASVGAGPGAAPLDQTEVLVPDAPYFKIPITDRFNYASSDCSARVHAAQRSARSAASILSSKKDRYMLSPCAEKNQFVVVELCDDIRIDTVQLANYEFFSGVFKDFSVYVAKTYTSDPEAWTFAGAYKAKNDRGVQSFHTPTTLSDFYRFIRVEFHSHYGNEYYCPLSLLRVYGLTHLEHWKWEQWEAESKARRALEIVPISQPEIVVESTLTSSVPWTDLPEPPKRDTPALPVEATSVSQEGQSTTPVPSLTSSDSATHEPAAESAALSSLQTSSSAVDSTTGHPVSQPDLPGTSSSPKTTQASSTASKTSLDTNNDHSRQHNTDTSLYTIIAPSEARPSSSVSLSDSISALSDSSSSSSHYLPSGSSQSQSQSLSVSSPANQSAHVTRPTTSTPSAITTVTQSLTTVPHVSAPAPATSGESIYRTIMNRLTALENNSSLYARFVEEHAASVREMLRRLGEDIGRLEGIGRAQAQMYQRSVSQFERQQRRLELEHHELLSRVSRLTDEVVLEKRLGIAQLCLLLAVLVFMAFTRGSRSEPLPRPVDAAASAHSRTPPFVGWGQRTLNISGDWVNKLRHRSLSPSSSTAPTETPDKPSREATDLPVKVDFPSQGVQTGEAFPRSKRPHPITGSHRKVGSMGRPRTPQSARAHPFRHSSPPQPSTPTTASSAAAPSARPGHRPPIQRAHSSVMSQSFSMDTIGPVPKSARRWAHTAHLHEVKSSTTLGASRSEDGASRRPSESENENEGGEPAESRPGGIFGARSDSPIPVAGKSVAESVGLGLVEVDVVSEVDGWVDTDAESDSEYIRGS